MKATHDEACARVAALYGPRWLRHYAASKLRRDPIFAAAFELLRDSRDSILDLGCGVGLLPFYLRERGVRQPIIALDIDARKIGHARAVATRYDAIDFVEHDLGEELPDFCGNITVFDVLHYLAPARQRALLRALAPRVSPDGALLVRDCPRDGSARFWVTYFAERFAQTISWNVGVPLHFPSREQLADTFDADEFIANEQSMCDGSPFNNRLFTWRRRSPAVAPVEV